MEAELKPRYSRMDWHEYYVTRFNKTGDKQAEILAMWYLFLHLAFDGEQE